MSVQWSAFMFPSRIGLAQYSLLFKAEIRMCVHPCEGRPDLTYLHKKIVTYTERLPERHGHIS